ncbi:MAG: TetR-like C-terminal domain-containing protein [Myxococcota bacterium]
MTRAQVVQAAVEVVRSEGADALGVSKVAGALGIKPPSLYNHIGSGSALARAVVLEANRGLVESLKAAVRGVHDPGDQLSALAEATRAWALANGGLYTLMARVEPDNDHPDNIPVYRDLLDLFARPLGQLGVGDDDIIHAIRGVRASIHGFVLLESTGQFQLEVDRQRSYRWLVDTVIAGVAGRS